MKKLITTLIAIITIIFITAIVGCSNAATTTSSAKTDSIGNANVSDDSATIIYEDAAADSVFSEVEDSTEEFSIVTEDGAFTEDNGVYTITAAGTYTLSGYLDGQIIVEATDEDKVVIELSGATISCDTDSPIKILSADKVEISAKKGTENLVKDLRDEMTADDDTQGKGAIYAKCDLELKGKGVLVVKANYKNGIHTSEDLTIKNLSLKVTAVDNAIKGNDSITIESGTIVAISEKGDGIKTENSDVSSKGNQRGTITIEDGTIYVYAAGDAVQASYDFVMNGGTLTVYTGAYSSYTSSSATTDSYKGVKAENVITVNDGTLHLYSYDDGLHANYGTALENGEVGLGNITINGGTIDIRVYSPTNATPSGRMGRPGMGGWGGQQTVKGSDAIHADNTLTIVGGTITVDSAYEGLEATHIVISGGETTVFATDDGVNACSKISGTPSIDISDGYLFVTVPTNGDTDGIDSNGTYTQTGGTVIVCGPGSASGGMGGGSFALDAEKTITLRGGTLVIFGGLEKTPSVSGMTRTVCSSKTVSAGTHTVTVNGENLEISLKYSTSGCVVYSANGSATLK